MDKGSWLVLCALTIEREHSTRDAILFMFRAARDDVRIVNYPSIGWWAEKYVSHLLHFIQEEGGRVRHHDNGWTIG